MSTSPHVRGLRLVAVVSVAAAIVAGACGPAASGGISSTPSATSPAPASPERSSGPSQSAPLGGSLTIYSGRSEELVGPLIDRFEQQSGLEVQVNYAGTSELAATILEEGDASPADVFFSQDAGALGALAAEDRLAVLPDQTLGLVDERFRSPDGLWVGVSGRARVVAYNTDVLAEDDLPDSILDFADPRWKGLIGWAPSNASLQSFVTALRTLRGEEAARAWLEGVQANQPKVYEGNAQALQGVSAGEVQVALVNHYYLLAAQADGTAANVANHFVAGGDPGALVNVAGAGVLATSQNVPAAIAFVEFLLSEESQRYFAGETYEYPLLDGVEADDRLTPLADIESPDIDLSDLADLEGTLQLMQEVGVL